MHGEDDAYATFSARLNKGQASISAALAALRAAVTKATVTKVRRAAVHAINSAGGAAIAWDTNVYALTGSWASTPNPTRVVLPKLGFWRVDATIGGTGMDSNLLRAWLTLNGTEIAESRHEQNGTTGKHDPFVRVSVVLNVTAVTQYVELWASTEAAGKTTRANVTTLTATWIGTI